MEKNRLEGLKITPKFPGNVYTNLPDILEQCTKNFTDDRERDVVLTSCLVILSGCFSNCKGKYGNDWIGPTLYGFIVSPPASGKGSMKYAKLLGKTIQNDFQTANLKAVETYDAKTKTWNKLIKKSKEEAGEPPKKPKCPVHFIPGNSSAASIYNLLSESDGKGTICETEADTLAGAIKQDWGNFSHLLRSAFHHEDLTMSRSTNNVYTTRLISASTDFVISLPSLFISLSLRDN